MSEFGQIEGEVCWRNGCQGVIKESAVEGCSCHIRPPCGQCTEPREYCPECDWRAKDDDGTFNDFSVKYANKSQAIFESWKPRPLDPRKVDWHSKSHTHFSMIKEGVYPDGTTKEEVEKLVRGTFGGGFSHFGNGKFKYIAYTD